jgi:hypothetical protein
MFHHARRKVLTLLVAIVFAAGGCFILQAQTRGVNLFSPTMSP